MRGRWLIVLSVVAIALVGIATLLALRGSGPSASETAINIAGLRPGHAIPVEVSLPDRKHTKARVFLVRTRDHTTIALLGISTHLGCGVRWAGDPAFEGFTARAKVEFEDPCGGSAFALDGACIGGPCPRGLDRYRVKVANDTAQFDLHHLTRGPLTGSS